MIRKSVDQLIKLDRTSFWIELEKHWNSGSPSGYGIDLPDPYDPKSQDGVFSLPVYEVSWDKATRIGPYPTGIHPPERLDIEHVPIHPLFQNTQDLFKEPVLQLYCTATSSGRTVAILDHEELCSFIKLDFPMTLGRFNRRIRLYTWLSSLGISAEIESARLNIPPNTAFLLETGGLYVETNNYNFGTLFRSANPFPIKTYDRIVPAFSLTMVGQNNRYSVELLRRVLGEATDISSFLSLAIEPIIDTYVWLALKRGLIPECNAQNALFCIDSLPITEPWTIVLRDFADFFVDLEIRYYQKLHTNFTRYKVIGAWSPENDLIERRSFAFDFKLGEYLLQPLVKVACTAFNLNELDLKEEIKALVRDRIPTRDYFGSEKSWYKYPLQEDVSRSNYQRMNNEPTFR